MRKVLALAVVMLSDVLVVPTAGPLVSLGVDVLAPLTPKTTPVK